MKPRVSFGDLELVMAGHTPVAVTLPTAGLMACAGFATNTAELMTLPLEVAKVRLQTQGMGVASAVGKAPTQYRGMVHCLSTMARAEGMLSLWSGLNAGLVRHWGFAPLRLGLYEPVRDRCQALLEGGKSDGSTPNISTRIVAAMATGALAMLLASPADLVKTRLQGEATKHMYRGVIHALVTITKSEGVPALWRGLGANLVRNSIINAAEVASYDTLRHAYEAHLELSGKPLSMAAGGSAGVVAAVVGSPIDIVKSRLMSAPKGVYRGILHCGTATVKKEGVMALYGGFLPLVVRLGSFNMLVFLAYEEYKGLLLSYVR